MASRLPPKPRGAAGAATLGACPICGKPADAASRPFCSPRCRQVDLHRWLSGAYAIPVVEEDGADGDADD